MPDRNEFLGDIIVCIAEDGGYNGWRQVVAYKWYEDDPGANYVHIIDIEEDDKRHEVDIDMIRRGLLRIEQGQISVRDSIIKTVREANKTNDAGEIDVEIADIILQAAIFDSYIYG